MHVATNAAGIFKFPVPTAGMATEEKALALAR